MTNFAEGMARFATTKAMICMGRTTTSHHLRSTITVAAIWITPPPASAARTIEAARGAIAAQKVSASVQKKMYPIASTTPPAAAMQIAVENRCSASAKQKSLRCRDPESDSCDSLLWDGYASAEQIWHTPGRELLGLLPDRDMAATLAGEGLAVPVAPPTAQSHPGKAGHEIQL
jgi:hypothetical protein